MSDTYDKLTCGNCGHDGGRKHTVEKAELEKKLAAALNVSNDTRQFQALVAGISSVIIVVTLAVTAYLIVPGLTDNPAAAKARHVADMYHDCVTRQTYDKDIISGIVQDCNDTFESFLKTVEPELK